ncbi:UNVERIFIED_CONTAM: Disease resistance protein RGA2 [Sesamum latifolium]|uniref:Disease resistance protein RGA2 n=1 Tax=Sesamum latifolium TaxID=2727402 RepID=A0AAW2UHI4_9LAMI
MAVAAYPALLSLTHVLDNVQHPAPRHRLHLDTKQIQSLQDEVQFLLEFLEVHSQRSSEEIEDLARQITVVADEAEDIIDCHVVDQLRDGSQDGSHHMAALSSFCQDIEKVIGKINSIMGELMMVQEEWTNLQEQKSIASLPTRSLEVLGKSNTMVGFNELLIRVMDELTTDEPALKILPIVGMGGIGKTTLARNIFDDPYIIHHFDKRIWLTISQEYSSREILMGLLSIEKTKFTVQMIDLSEVHVASQSTSFASLPVCNECKKMYPNLTRLRLVRVKVFNEGDNEFLHPTKLRCLDVNHENDLEFMSPSAVPLLWNLQTLSLSVFPVISKIALPPEIWEMPQLRHLIATEHAVLPDPTVAQDSIVIQNLQTLSYIRNFRCTVDIIKRVPNLKKVKICYTGEDRSTE